MNRRRRKASQPERKGNGDDYHVGYGKPPAHTRFAPGKSGNPKGRPKGVRNFKTDVKATLKSSIRLIRDGKPQKVSTQKAVLLRLLELALKGEARALERWIALAQTYDDDDVPPAASLSADDVMLLEIFRERVLKGAADNFDPGASEEE